MFILMFTRLTARLTDETREAIFLGGTYDTKEKAQEVMHKAWTRRIEHMGWDADYSNISENQAFCGTESMCDTCRFYIFDTEHSYGFENDLLYEPLGGDE